MKKIILFIIKFYKLVLSPIFTQVFGVKCRYSLTCSDFAAQKIEKEGVITGGCLSIKRFLSCQPFFHTYEYI